jgi:subtilisin family serine protease
VGSFHIKPSSFLWERPSKEGLSFFVYELPLSNTCVIETGMIDALLEREGRDKGKPAERRRRKATRLRRHGNRYAGRAAERTIRGTNMSETNAVRRWNFLSTSSVVWLVAAFLTTACRDSLQPLDAMSRPVASVRLPNDPAWSVVTSADVRNRKIPEEYIVVFDGDVDDVEGRARSLVNGHGGTLHYTYTTALRGFSAHMTAQAAEAIADLKGVAFVEQNQVAEATDVQTNATWGLDRVDQAALPLDGNYSYTETGADVNVYIIDTGIRRTHTQFGGRVVPAFNGVGDKYGPDGCHWHGTHVAGTIGGSLVGVAKSARLYSVRVLDCNSGGSVGGVIAGVDWVASHRTLPAIANMSLITGFSQSLNAAIENAIGAGVTFVVAAGNSNDVACNYSPASVKSAITVAASTDLDVEASFSNYGTCVDLFAPGTQVYSALNANDYAMGISSGTSMAAPHVTGIAALLLQRNPWATPAQIQETVVASATQGRLSGVVQGTPNLLARSVDEPLPAIGEPATAAPVASFSVSCPSSKSKCAFDASSSSDDNGVVAYQYDFGDGIVGERTTDPRALHNYQWKMNYTIRLTVWDAKGLYSTTWRSISVKSLSR